MKKLAPFVVAVCAVFLAGGLTLQAFRGHARQEGSQKNEKFDRPDEAMNWRLLSWRDEHGHIPPNGLGIAMGQREANLRGQMHPNSLAWSFVGANNISGRILALAVDPV